MNQSTLGAITSTVPAAATPRNTPHAGPGELQPETAVRNGGAAASVTISREAGQAAAIKEYVRRLFEEQGLELSGDYWDEMSVEDAQAAIAAGGEWGPEAVAGRIIDFVAGISEGNPELKERLKEAVRQGFEEARQALGGWLPEVSERTFELVMERFDEAFEQPEPAGDAALDGAPA